MANELPPLVVEVKLEVDRLKKQMSDVEAQLAKVGKSAESSTGGIGKMSDGLKGLAKSFGLMLGAAAVVTFLNDSAKAAVEDNKSFALMEQQLKTTTGATHEQAQAIDAQIGKLSEMSGVVDDKIRPAFSNLLRTTGDSTKAMEMTQLAMDIAAGTGKDLGTVSQALSRAYAGNSGALQKLVPGVKGASDAMGYLKTTFAGAAETAGNADPYAKMTVALDKIKETLGRALLPLINTFAKLLIQVSPIIELLSKIIGKVVDAVAPLIDQLMSALMPVFEALGELILKIVEKVLPPLIKVFDKVLMPVIMMLADYLITYLIPYWSALVDAISPLVDLVANVLVGAFNVLMDTLKPVWAILKPLIDGLLSLAGVDVNVKVDSPTSSSGFNTTTAEGIAAASKSGTTTGGTTTGGSKPSDTLKKQLADMKTYLADARAKVVEERIKYATAVTEAYGTYNKAVGDATRKRDADIAALEKAHADNVIAINKDFANRLQGIVQQSMDRLRSAFANVAKIDVGQIFSASLASDSLSGAVSTQMKNGIQTAVSWWGSPASTGGVGGLIDTLKTKLASAKKLTDNAAALSGAGFTQTFIEQVVAQGGDAGNKMAEQILAATPEAQKELQGLFVESEKTANTGMDALSKAIYDKSGLATDELKKLYSQTQSDLVQSLADEQAAYVQQQADIHATFVTAMADANSTLKKSLNDAGVAMNAALDKIEKEMTTKLGTMKGKLGSLSTVIGSLRNLIGGSYTAGNAPVVLDFASASGQASSTLAPAPVTINSTVNANTGPVSPNDVSLMVTNGIKYNLPYITAGSAVMA